MQLLITGKQLKVSDQLITAEMTTAIENLTVGKAACDWSRPTRKHSSFRTGLMAASTSSINGATEILDGSTRREILCQARMTDRQEL